MHGRTPTKAEKEHMDLVAQVGCIVCIVYFEIPDLFGQGNCEVHHLEGSRAEGCHHKTIGLCTRHHRQKDNQKPPRWISRHGNDRNTFEGEYAPEADLLQMQLAFNQKLREASVL